MLISVHLPKTAGSSFRSALEQHFGDSLRLEYEQRPLHQTPMQRRRQALSAWLHNALGRGRLPGTRCIHGHFLPLQYRSLRTEDGLIFITWMREPTQRLISHYHYWQRVYDPEGAPLLHRRMMEERWSLEAFAARPELRNVYGKFLWGFPLRRFAFVGISEHFDSELEFFCRRYLGAQQAQPATENRNPRRADEGYAVSPELREIMTRLHRQDLRLYASALRLREERLSNVGEQDSSG